MSQMCSKRFWLGIKLTDRKLFYLNVILDNSSWKFTEFRCGHECPLLYIFQIHYRFLETKIMNLNQSFSFLYSCHRLILSNSKIGSVFFLHNHSLKVWKYPKWDGLIFWYVTHPPPPTPTHTKRWTESICAKQTKETFSALKYIYFIKFIWLIWNVCKHSFPIFRHY